MDVDDVEISSFLIKKKLEPRASAKSFRKGGGKGADGRRALPGNGVRAIHRSDLGWGTQSVQGLAELGDALSWAARAEAETTDDVEGTEIGGGHGYTPLAELNRAAVRSTASWTSCTVMEVMQSLL